MAAITAPERTAAQHQSLLHFVGEGTWSDEKVLAKIREMVLPEIERHGPIEAWIIDDTGFPKKVDAANRYRTLLDLVISRQAALIAKWQLVGFIHGVMNTDNMSIAGETIDYGPCAFMDVYHPETVYSSIDNRWRYAYGNQPRIAQWNLARLAETFLPLLAEDKDAAVKEAQEAIDAFATGFETAYAAGLSRKLMVVLEMADHGLDGSSASHLAANDFCVAKQGVIACRLKRQNEPKFNFKQ